MCLLDGEGGEEEAGRDKNALPFFPPPGGCDAMWKKPDRERQTLHELTYMWNQNKQKIQKLNS